MSSKHDSADQADVLRKQMENHTIDEKEPTEEIQVSTLPPRKEVHGKKESHVKLRFRYPVIRFFAIAFGLIVILVATYNIWRENLHWANSTDEEETTSSNVDVFEMKSSEPVIKDEFVFSNVDEDDEEEENTEETSKSETEKENVETKANPTEQENESNEEDVTKVESESLETSSEDSYIVHQVKVNETLYRISMKYFNSRAGEEIIKKANHLDANGTIFVGQRLIIPIDEPK